MRKVLFVLYLLGLALTAINASIIQSTLSGGPWDNTSTWLNGVIPGSADDVVINGTVTVNSTKTCNNMTINTGGNLYNWTSGNSSITIYGDLINNGVLSNNPGAYSLTMNLHGDLFQNGTLTPFSIYLDGAGNSTISCSIEHPISFTNAFYINAAVDTLFALTDIFILGGSQISGSGAICNISLIDPVTSLPHSLTMTNVNFNNAIVYGGVGSEITYTNGNLISVELYDCDLYGTYSFGISSFTHNCVNYGIFQNYTSGNVVLNIDGYFYNRGIVRNNPSAYSFTLNLNNGISNEGLLTPLTCNLLSSGNVSMYTNPSYPINCTNFYVGTDVDTLFAIDDLYIQNVSAFSGNSEYVLYLSDSSYAGNYNLHVTNSNFSTVSVVGRGESNAYLNNCTISSSELSNLNLYGELLLGTNTHIYDVVNHSRIRNALNGYKTLYVHGDFANYGILENNPSAYYMYVYLYDNVYNYGTWSARDLKLLGFDTQYISFDYEHEFMGYNFIDDNTTTGVIAASDLYFNNTVNVDFNNSTLDLTGGYDIYLSNSNLKDVVIVSDTTSVVDGGLNANLTNFDAIDITLAGTIILNSALDVSGILINNGVIKNFTGGVENLNVGGTLYNFGSIINNPSAYSLNINLYSDLHNYGIINVANTNLYSDVEQQIGNYETGQINTTNCIDYNSNSAVLFDSDIELTNTTFDLNNAPLFLNGYNLRLVGGILRETDITSGSVGAILIGINAVLNHVTSSDLTLDGSFKLESGIEFGTLNNYATLSNQNGSTVTLTVLNQMNNFGTLTNGTSYSLNLLNYGDFFNYGFVTINSIYFRNSVPRSIYNDVSADVLRCQYLKVDGSSSVQLLSDLSFQDTQLDCYDNTLVLYNGLTPYDITISGGKLYRAVLETNGFSELNLTNNCYLQEIEAGNTQLIIQGTPLFYSNVTLGDVINYGTMSNYFSNTTVEISHDFINYGTVSNLSQNLTLNCYGDLSNHGTLSQTGLNIYGTENQNLIVKSTDIVSTFRLYSDVGSAGWYHNSVSMDVTASYITLPINLDGTLGTWQPITSGGIEGRLISISRPGTLNAPVQVAIQYTGSQISLSWEEVANSSFYRIYSCSTPNGTYQLYQDNIYDQLPGDGVVNYTLSPEGQMLFYQIKAVN
ncbi:MAG: hypothetical protein JXR56_07585 [Candidatus Cloacimonetes bacterium]|nr:hypothetical protein [Candidatus Cloacimonadota bacterium]